MTLCGVDVCLHGTYICNACESCVSSVVDACELSVIGCSVCMYASPVYIPSVCVQEIFVCLQCVHVCVYVSRVHACEFCVCLECPCVKSLCVCRVWVTFCVCGTCVSARYVCVCVRRVCQWGV